MEREHGILDGGTRRHTLKIRRIDRAGIKQHYCFRHLHDLLIAEDPKRLLNIAFSLFFSRA